MLCLCALDPGAAREQERPRGIRVGLTPNFPPLVFREGGAIRGLEADFAARLERDLGVPFGLVELPWRELIPALLEGRIDVIMSGMSITPERGRRVHFCSPYLRSGQMALVRGDDAQRLGDPGAWGSPDVRVGFERETTGEEYVRGRLAGAQPVGFDDAADGIEALRAGTIDLLVHDAPTIWRTVGGAAAPESPFRGIYVPLTDERLAWAVRPEEAGGLGARLSSALERWRTSGELDLLLARWIPVRKVALDPQGRAPSLDP